MKGKVIDFLNPYHVVKNGKDFFEFHVSKDQSSVTEKMEICLPTTCKLLGIPRHIGQAAKASLLHKEEAATKVLSTVAENKYVASNFIDTFLTNSLFWL